MDFIEEVKKFKDAIRRLFGEDEELSPGDPVVIAKMMMNIFAAGASFTASVLFCEIGFFLYSHWSDDEPIGKIILIIVMVFLFVVFARLKYVPEARNTIIFFGCAGAVGTVVHLLWRLVF